MLNGLDSIGLTLQHEEAISAYEKTAGLYELMARFMAQPERRAFFYREKMRSGAHISILIAISIFDLIKINHYQLGIYSIIPPTFVSFQHK
jgi:hypothetical protein